jgi:N-acetylglucosaminyldiphosphoundecaprenol N-acetyl-beta-D-mannosaminyltransferase
MIPTSDGSPILPEAPVLAEVPVLAEAPALAEAPVVSLSHVPAERSDEAARPQAVESAETVEASLPILSRRTIWNMPFDRVTMQQAVDHIEALVRRGRPSYVITANLNYAMLHNRSDEMPEITRDADLILADGQPIVLRSKLGKDPLPERVAGSEMIYHLAERASQHGWGIYFLGGEPGVAEICAERLVQRYPGLQIAGVDAPPFRKLSEQEQAEQDDQIMRSGAKILLVAFGQPKGERWIHQHYQRLGIPVSIQLGASFDFIAGTAKRAPRLWQHVGAEWAYRMLSDPRRLVPRYAANAKFLMEALLEDWRRQVTGWGMGQWVDGETDRRG